MPSSTPANTANDDIVIVAARRTPIGAFMGQFSTVSAPQLGSAAIKAVMQTASISEVDISEVLMGCVLSAGLGQAAARQAALGAGLNIHTPCTTINKVCGSGLKTVMQAHDAIVAGSSNIVIAGGMESMTNAPYLLPKGREGMRFGHGEVLDHMLCDGLQNAYDGQAMGIFAEHCVDRFEFTREQQDSYATESVNRALAACNGDAFDNELAAVSIASRKGEQIIDKDETPYKCNTDKIPNLRPAFKKEGS
ncbi:acetyl-CoA C-acetyltransferase, partial [Pseudomonadota bacterium]